MSHGDEAAARVGDVLDGKYELGPVLGVGGMGVVYEAEHAITHKRVAVKVLHRRFAESEGHARRFVREARAATAIGHPAIVDVLDVGRDADGRLYLVLELLEGESLAAAIERRALSVADVVAIGIQLLEGLHAAHERGIVHRDIKPENVFLARTPQGTNEQRVKILDFGIAKHMLPDAAASGGLTVEGTVLGTPRYMSPEQARGEPVDGRTDIWATGALLYHALGGAPPFPESNANVLVARILTERAPSLRTVRPDVPGWLVSVIDRALEPDVARRWPSALAMAETLSAQSRADDLHDPRWQTPISQPHLARMSSPTDPVTAPMASTPRAWVRARVHTAEPERRRARWIALGGALAIVAGGIAMLAWPSRSSAPAPRVDARTPARDAPLEAVPQRDAPAAAASLEPDAGAAFAARAREDRRDRAHIRRSRAAQSATQALAAEQQPDPTPARPAPPRALSPIREYE